MHSCYFLQYRDGAYLGSSEIFAQYLHCTYKHASLSLIDCVDPLTHLHVWLSRNGVFSVSWLQHCDTLKLNVYAGETTPESFRVLMVTRTLWLNLVLCKSMMFWALLHVSGSNVNQEVVQMAAASAVEILHPQVVKDAVAEAVFILAKRQKYTNTHSLAYQILDIAYWTNQSQIHHGLRQTWQVHRFVSHSALMACRTCDSTNIIIVTLRSVLIVCCICIVFWLHKATAVSPHLW